MKEIIYEELAALKKEIAATQTSPDKSPQEILETEDSEIIDRLSKNNEHFFHNRFKFIKPRIQRQHIIYLKNQFDLTDNEIKNLEYTKSIKIEHGKPSIVKSDGSMYNFAKIIVPCCTALSLISIAASVFSLIIGSSETSYLIVCAMLSAIAAWHLHVSAIKPIDILKKRSIKPGQELILQDKHFIAISETKSQGQASPEKTESAKNIIPLMKKNPAETSSPRLES